MWNMFKVKRTAIERRYWFHTLLLLLTVNVVEGRFKSKLSKSFCFCACANKRYKGQLEITDQNFRSELCSSLAGSKFLSLVGNQYSGGKFL